MAVAREEKGEGRGRMGERFGGLGGTSVVTVGRWDC